MHPPVELLQEPCPQKILTSTAVLREQLRNGIDTHLRCAHAGGGEEWDTERRRTLPSSGAPAAAGGRAKGWVLAGWRPNGIAKLGSRVFTGAFYMLLLWAHLSGG